MFGTSLLWRSTVAFTYLKVKSAKCLSLGLLPVVLVLLLLFWSWSCKQRSWSCLVLLYSLGLKNLVLFTSLTYSHGTEFLSTYQHPQREITLQQSWRLYWKMKKKEMMTSSPDSAEMDDRLGMLPARHPGQLSLLIPLWVGRRSEYRHKRKP